MEGTDSARFCQGRGYEDGPEEVVIVLTNDQSGHVGVERLAPRCADREVPMLMSSG